MFNVRPVWETAVHLAVAGGVFEGVFLCCPFSRKSLNDDPFYSW